MANIIVIAGVSAAMVAGAATQLVKPDNAARVPGWFEVPAHVAVSNISGSPGEGRFDLSFAGASDNELKAVQAGLEGKGFTLALRPSHTGGISRAIVAHDGGTGRRIEINLTELPDHDVWQVSYVDSEQG